MKIREKVEEMVKKNSSKYELNIQGEIWNILYNILENLGLESTDIFDENNEMLISYLYYRESMIPKRYSRKY